jgi:hypothetical protein
MPSSRESRDLQGGSPDLLDKVMIATPSATDAPSHFYRFRPVEALLDKYEELEKQEIYFCPPDQLNDPMEGYKDLFWRGDEIVWRNLLRHYLACLVQSVVAAFGLREAYTPAISRNFVFTTPSSLPTPQLKELHQRVCASVLGKKVIAELPSTLARRALPLRREEVEFCLRAMHGIALNAVLGILRADGHLPQLGTVAPPKVSEKTVLNHFARVMKGLEEHQIDSDPAKLAALFGTSEQVNRQMDLIRYLDPNDDLSRAWHGIFYAFPEHYVDGLQDLVFFNWYAACFVADPTHAAMWGHYGNGHKGVALKFRAEQREGQAHVLKLQGINGWQAGPKGDGPTHGDITLAFERMNYRDKLHEVDFFRSIGRLPVPTLKSGWYGDELGNRSACADDVLTNMNEWHQRYWSSFKELTLTKLRDWQYEDEYRLTLMSSLDFFDDPKDRKLKYRFSDLDGIVFGIRTPLAEKARIIEIVRTKCLAAGRKSFAFSQAVYGAQSGRIEIRPMDLIRFD